MDIVTLGQAKADAKARYADAVYGVPRQKVIAWFAGDDLGGSLGDQVTRWKDRSGHGADLSQLTTPPTLKPTGLNSKPTVLFGTGTRELNSAVFGTVNEPGQIGAYPQPLTYLIVCKLASATNTLQTLIGGGGATQVNLIVNSGTGHLQIHGGSTGPFGDRPVNDDGWHVLVGACGVSNGYTMIDGYVASSTSSTLGTNSLGNLAVGGAYGGGNLCANGEVAEVVIVNELLTPARVASMTAALNTKWNLGLTVPAQDVPAFWDTTDSAGVTVRVWTPPTLKIGGTAPLVILSHQAGGTEQITPSSPGYTLVRALVNAGYVVGMSRMHSDSWGNANAITDLNNLYTLISSKWTVSRTIMASMSMGGVATALSAAGMSALPNIKGAFAIDAVFSLAAMYASATYTTPIDTAYGITRSTLSAGTSAGATSLPTTGSFPTPGTQLLVGNGTANAETVTTTGASNGTSVAVTACTKTHASGDQVSDFSSKTSGRDPVTKSAASYPSSLRWRFYASTADTTVNEAANTDAMRTLLASNAPVEMALVTHPGTGHLANQGFRPSDVVAFCDRCV